ncbi:hypothetical protein H0H10_30590 [Streptomyces sp. TRM S81-3]|uniref:Uncharacterized protein n=1 Tax=Streptomyces griseicoloratus TaxID=2752516 RepID=A0A926L7J9_9ACTN|nr:hypothetical protein [Streptomyces griseicoloratus]MBD0423455.1 hypothetical protein [Streptomyces griseicoloratus]
MPDRDFHDTPSSSPGEQPGTGTGTDAGAGPGAEAERRRRRARFLRELAEARALRDRVQPRRAKAARLRHVMRMRTFRW